MELGIYSLGPSKSPEIILSSQPSAGQRKQRGLTQLMDSKHSDGRCLRGHKNPLINLGRCQKAVNARQLPNTRHSVLPGLQQLQTPRLPNRHHHHRGQDTASCQGRARSREALRGSSLMPLTQWRLDGEKRGKAAEMFQAGNDHFMGVLKTQV